MSEKIRITLDIEDPLDEEPELHTTYVDFWCEGTKRIRHKREVVASARGMGDTWSWNNTDLDSGEGEQVLLPNAGYVPLWRALWEAVGLPEESIGLIAQGRLDPESERLLDEAVDQALLDRGLGVSTDLLEDAETRFRTIVSCPNPRCSQRMPVSDETLSARMNLVVEAHPADSSAVVDTFDVVYEDPKMQDLMGKVIQHVWTLPISIFSR